MLDMGRPGRPAIPLGILSLPFAVCMYWLSDVIRPLASSLGDGTQSFPMMYLSSWNF